MADPFILLTRPKAQSAKFAEALAQEGVSKAKIVQSPIQEIVFKNFAVPQGNATLIFSSQNGVESISGSAELKGRAAICVGAKTTQAARAAGFDAVLGGPDIHGVLPMLTNGPYVHIRGAHTTLNLVETLTARAISAQEIITYDQVAKDLSPQAIGLLQGGRPAVVPLFSVRSTQLLGSAMSPWESHTAVSISPAVDQICADWGFSKRIVATTPDADAMIKATCQVFDSFGDLRN